MTCVHCGHPLREGGRFCPECGTPVVEGGAAPAPSPPQPAAPAPIAPAEAAAPPPRPGGIVGKSTVMGGVGASAGKPNFSPTSILASPRVPGGDAASAKTLMHFAGSQPAAPAAAARPAFQRTMLGMANVPAPPAVGDGSPQPPAAPGTPPLGTAAPLPPSVLDAAASNTKPAHKQTMLGVAMPGIAPLREAAPLPPLSQPAIDDDPQPNWLIPPAQRMPPPMPIVPAPAPLADLPPPLPPTIVRTKGVPLVTVALLAGGLLLVGGGIIALLSRTPSGIVATPQSTPDGKDTLHLRCDPRSCKDGTMVEVAGARATFAGGECDLVLAQPLHVGNNELALHVDRPGLGRDENVKLVVPVVYRINADATPMSATPPSVAIRVRALPGSEVTVDGKHVDLDANGNGSYLIDETAATEGPADESKVVSVEVPYSVVPRGAKAEAAEQGTVGVRIPIAPLRVDSPRGHLVTDKDHVQVSGRAPKGATVMVDGAAVPSSADGVFEASVPLPAVGERSIEVRAATPALSPRRVQLTVNRVDRLADQAKVVEASKPIGYDAAMASLGDSVGRPMVVDGEVVESRGSVMLVDDRRGCAKGPCPTRVVLAEDASFNRGATVRAYGRVARPFRTPAGQTVPEVEADFVMPVRR